MDDDFPMALIAAEEGFTQEEGDAGPQFSFDVEDTRTYTYDFTGRRYDDDFDTPPNDQVGIEGPGYVQQFMVYADSPNFEIRITLDGTNFILDSFRDIQEHSPALNNVTAMERDQGYLFSVEELNYTDRALFRTFPQEKIHFRRIRLVVDAPKGGIR